jgi:SAM-dependent methyltransferase
MPIEQPGSDYEPAAYWIARHEQLAGDIRSVGNKGKSVAENEAAYRERAAALRAFVADLIGEPAGRSALELGCGIGLVAEALIGIGFAYTGIDVAPVAIAAARRRCPSGTFLEGDARSFRDGRLHDVTVAAYVLCHMVRDTDWRQVIRNARASTKPGGALLLIDRIPEREPQLYGNYVRHRPLPEMVEGLSEEGFGLDVARARGDLHIAWRTPD